MHKTKKNIKMNTTIDKNYKHKSNNLTYAIKGSHNKNKSKSVKYNKYKSLYGFNRLTRSLI
jgi:hypothetical protein